MAIMKEKILLRALENAPLNGWSMNALRMAAKDAGQKPQMTDALFGSIAGATGAVSAIFDDQMMDALSSIDSEKLRVRDRIAKAVTVRLDLMAPYKDGLRVALAHWARPLRSLHAAKPLWRSADQIWDWAGDTARDYNHYTKRALLSGVMASTLLFWLQDNSPAHTATKQFLDRRISNVLSVGKLLGSMKKKAA